MSAAMITLMMVKILSIALNTCRCHLNADILAKLSAFFNIRL